MQVRQRPAERPTITYRIAVDGGTLAAGTDVPYEHLAEQFDEAATRKSVRALLDRLGLTLMGPTTGVSDNGGRPILYAPFLEVAAELGSDRLRGSRTRLVTIDFEGLYPE